ncbi:MAG: ImmA/IrrE family metallo-endopeptidase [Armatimonadia bacterium]|nr:ImmA/IrrE family metallo-endopeptidase [Armatimonadia bacterium]
MDNAIQNDYRPDEVSPPGETLADVIEDRGMSQASLARRTGLSTKTICGLIAGREPLSQDTALALETVLGVPARFWNSREAAYRESLARRAEEEKRAQYGQWTKQFPYSDGVKLGFLEPTRKLSDRVRSLCAFFAISSPEAYGRVREELLPAWREERTAKGDVHARAMWMRMGEIKAQEMDCQPYDKAAFRAALDEARKLTCVRDPEDFVQRLQDLCAGCGVAVVFVPELKGTAAYGATRWLSPAKAMIALSLRRKTNDQLWFAFFHEAGHILLHGRRDVFMERDSGIPRDEALAQKEEEANRFAADHLIPRGRYEEFIFRGLRGASSIREFAKEVGIAPGIVVGRLQREKHIKYNRHNDLKVRYQWSGGGEDV